MKKLVILILIAVLTFSFAACSGGGEEDSNDKPPAFSVIQKQLKLNKHTKKGESATFSQEEFENMLGETLTYITVTSLPDAEKGTLVYNGTSVMSGQSLPAAMLKFLKFVPSITCREASFNFTCDSAGYNGTELTCEMVFADSANSPPVVTDSVISTVSGIALEGNLLITEPNGDEFTVNVISYPSDGYITVEPSGRIVYTPMESFSGKDSLVFTVTDKYGAVSERATLTVEVTENESGLHFVDMQNDLRHIYAHKMCENNVMVYRYENGGYYFDPDETVSRMEFLVMLMCISGQDNGINAVADSIAADDGGLSSGIKGYISAAADKGIIVLDNGNFSPKTEITLGEAAAMTSAALKLPNSFSGTVSASNSDRIYNALASAVSAGIIETDTNGSVDSLKKLTKAEVAMFLCKVSDYMTENNMK